MYAHLLLFIAFLILLFSYFHPIPLQGANVDLGYHLTVGEIIVNTATIPSSNIFAYTAVNFPYINTSWLSQVILFEIYHYFSFEGLIIFSMVLISATFFLLVKTSEIKNKYYASSIVLLIYSQILIDRTEVKTELFSLFLLACFLYILYRNKTKPTKLLFLLPLLQLAWVNMHIFFIVGIGTITLFFIDTLRINNYQVATKKMFPITLITVLSYGAILLNPQFIKGALYPFSVFQNYGYNVIENYNYIFALQQHADITFLYFSISVILLWMGIFIYKKKLTVIDILLTALFTFLAFSAVRNFSLFVIGTFIPAVKIIDLSINLLEKRFSESIVQNVKITLTLLLFLFITPAIIWGYTVHSSGMGVLDDASTGVNLLKGYHISGPVYNNYNIGNYLVYAIYPQEKVFVHGSPEAYPKDFFSQSYYPIESSFEDFRKASNKFNFNSIIYDHVNQTTNNNLLLANLIKSQDWSLVFINNRIVIFVKNIPEYQVFINKYKIVESNLQLQEKDTNTKEKVMSLSNLFRIFGWYEKMYEMDLRYLDYDPRSCVALRHVIFYLSQTNNPLNSTYIQRFQNSCE